MRTRLRSTARRLLPQPWRRTLRTVIREAPHRALDSVPDLFDKFRANPLPPARFRYRVAGTSSRAEFRRLGVLLSESVEAIFHAAVPEPETYSRWLDFGCGCGRVGRHLARMAPVREYFGADVDRCAIEWCARNLPGQFVWIPENAGLPFPASRFDVVYAGSVFSHFDAGQESAWLSEVHRVLRSGGVFIASTHSPQLSSDRPDLSDEERQELITSGFLFAEGAGSFNERSAFHSREYLMRTWGALFGLLYFVEFGSAGYQDLAVWRKW